MEQSELLSVLEKVANGDISVENAMLRLKQQPFSDIGYAKIDHHRGLRQGTGEVIYGAGKTPEQICGIISSMLKNLQHRVLRIWHSVYVDAGVSENVRLA